MRKSKPKKRYFLPDPIFKDTLVTQFVNNLMKDGKKSTSYSIFYDALKIVEDKTKDKGLDIWKKALNNVMPSVEVKSRRVGGANFQDIVYLSFEGYGTFGVEDIYISKRNNDGWGRLTNIGSS